MSTWDLESADELYWSSVEFHDPWCTCGWCVAHTTHAAAVDSVVFTGVYTTESQVEA